MEQKRTPLFIAMDLFRTSYIFQSGFQRRILPFIVFNFDCWKYCAFDKSDGFEEEENYISGIEIVCDDCTVLYTNLL